MTLPGPGDRSRAARLSLVLLRALCATFWNPIGVAMRLEGTDPSGLPDDEYDRYLLELRDLLDGGAEDDEIIAYLAEAEQYMGLSQPSGDKARFLAELRRACAGLS